MFYKVKLIKDFMKNDPKLSVMFWEEIQRIK